MVSGSSIIANIKNLVSSILSMDVKKGYPCCSTFNGEGFHRHRKALVLVHTIMVGRRGQTEKIEVAFKGTAVGLV